MPVYPGRFTTRQPALSIILLLIVALLLPVYAPWLNPGYAAAQAGHGHIYLGDVDVEHHEHPALPHHHSAPKGVDAPEQVDGVAGVIMLPNQDAAGRVMPLLASAGDLTGWIKQSGAGTISFSLGAAFVGVMLVYLSRVVPPPRPQS